jgi:sucrose-6-phosphate hydrolase SacC (GH32 family)
MSNWIISICVAAFVTLMLCGVTCASDNGYTWWAPPHEYLKDHTIIEKDGVFHLFSICGTAGQDWLQPWTNNNEETFLHAISKDLLNWEMKGYVLRTGSEGEADYSKIWAPHVILHNGVYYMFYAGVTHEKEGWTDHVETICLATSTDLEHWTKHKPNPVYRAPGWATGSQPPIAARDPMVIRDEENKHWIMYYTALYPVKDGLKNAVGIAISDDLINWKDAGIAVKDDRNGATESPFVVKRDGKYYIFMNDRISVSDDPVKGWSEPKPYSSPAPGFAGEVILHKGKYLRTVVGKDGKHFHITTSEIIWQNDNCSFRPWNGD